MAGLCSWAQAMTTYHKVAVEVEPKSAAARVAEGELRQANKEKDEALSQLAEVQAKLDDMQASLGGQGMHQCRAIWWFLERSGVAGMEDG